VQGAMCSGGKGVLRPRMRLWALVPTSHAGDQSGERIRKLGTSTQRTDRPACAEMDSIGCDNNDENTW
jgi:hypothetical protein